MSHELRPLSLLAQTGQEKSLLRAPCLELQTGHQQDCSNKTTWRHRLANMCARQTPTLDWRDTGFSGSPPVGRRVREMLNASLVIV